MLRMMDIVLMGLSISMVLRGEGAREDGIYYWYLIFSHRECSLRVCILFSVAIVDIVVGKLMAHLLVTICCSLQGVSKPLYYIHWHDIDLTLDKVPIIR